MALGRAVYDFCVPFQLSCNRRPDRIVISGFGCLTPLGNSRDELWNGYREARSGVRRISAFDPSRFGVQIAGEVRGVDPYAYFQAKERPHLSRAAALAVWFGDLPDLSEQGQSSFVDESFGYSARPE